MKTNQTTPGYGVRLLSLALGWFSLAGLLHAQAPDDLNPGPDLPVYALALQPDGKILVGGSFTNLAGHPRNCLGQLNADGSLDTGFNPGAGNRVYCLALQPDGKILVGGSFTNLGGVPCNRLGRLNADGTLDGTFSSGANSTVYCLALQPDGKILVGGAFTNLSGQLRRYLGRLNPDGTADSGFSAGADATVDSIVVQADGGIVVGGSFTNLAGQVRHRLGRLNADGSLDNSFNPRASGSVYGLALQPDGRILVAGSFTTLGGVLCSGLGRLTVDGTAEASFVPAVGGGAINSLALQADGKILVGGGFITFGGQAHRGLGRLNPDGTIDSTFTPEANGGVNCLAVQADGKVLVGGNFTTLGGQPRKNLGRLTNTEAATETFAFDGSTVTWLRSGPAPEVAWTRFDASTNGNEWISLGAGQHITGGWQVAGLNLPTNATIWAWGFAGGGYYNGSSWVTERVVGPSVLTAQPLSRTNYAGTVATFSVTVVGESPLSYQWFNEGTAITNDGNILGAQSPTLILSGLSGGDAGEYLVVISNAFGSVTSQVATLAVVDPFILNQPLSQWRNVGENAPLSVRAGGTSPFSYQWRKDGADLPGATAASLILTNVQLADAGGYSVVVSNAFGSVTSLVAVLRVVTPALPDSLDPQANGPVFPLAVQADGGVLVGGQFTVLGGQPRSFVGRLNGDGAVDMDFNPGANGTLYCMAVQADGKILVGGAFTTLGAQPCAFVGRLGADGAVDRSFAGSANATVYCLAAQPDGRMLVGGDFGTLAGSAHRGIGRLNPDGIVDDGFNASADGTVQCLAMQPDGKILVGGQFTTLSEQPRNCLGRLDAEGMPDLVFNPGANAAVNCLAVQPGGKILVGGGFTTLGGQPRSYIGRLNPDGSVDLTFNPGADNVVNSIALQADGGILIGGSFTMLRGRACRYLGRLNPDGTLDTSFTADADNVVCSVVVQVDGRVLVGGSFTTLSGQPRARIGRLTNTDPATKRLSFDGATVQWLRGGTSPEVWRTTFEFSTNGLDWVGLGAGQRVTGGWQMDGASFGLNPTIRARGFVASGYFSSSSWLVETGLGPPAVASQPASRSSLPGTSASFTVAAVGTGPLAYQWWKDGSPLRDGEAVFGAQTPTLMISNLVAGDAGSYSVVISNFSGSVTSLVARLFVTDLYLVSQPLSLTTNAGAVATFTVLVASTAPVSYQWWKNEALLTDGGNIQGAQTSTLTVSNVFHGDEGAYWVIVSNAFGSVTSEVARLSVVDPFILSQPASQLVEAGQAVVFSVVPTGTPPTTFQWFNGEVSLVDGQRVSGAQTPSLTLSNVLAADAGGYAVVVSNAFGSMTSSVATLQVVDPSILSQPGDQVVGVGDTVLFSVTAGGTPPLGYQWAKNGLRMDGATGAVLTLTNVQRADAGTYNVVVSNALGSVTSAVAVLTVYTTPADSFDPGANGAVVTVAVEGDGKLFVGGAFTVLAGQNCSRIGRLNADGTLDSSFNSGADNWVYAMAVSPDGKVVAAGAFFAIGGQTRSHIARLKADGTVDKTFNPGADDVVYCLAMQADGKILVGGAFGLLGGQPRSYIGRLNPDGSVDLTFNPGANAPVNCLAVQPDGLILVGGSFGTLGGAAHRGIGRLNTNGVPDTTFNPIADNSVYVIALQPEGKILVGGAFATLNGQSRNYLGRLNPDGTLEANVNLAANDAVYSIAVQANGSALAGGAFGTIGGHACTGLGRINANGTVDVTFNPGVDAPVNCLAIQADGRILVGGTFGTLAGQPRSQIGRLRNSDPAVQVLSFGSTTITWLRGGASPEIWGTSFDFSTNGLDWIGPFAGLRIAGGWQASVSGIPSSSTVRGHGFAAGGRFSGSSGCIEAAVGPPAITFQPVDQTRLAQTTALFSVTAVGTPPLGYQWYRDGISLGDGGDVFGAETATLRLTNLLGADVGGYSVVISNASGSVTSQVATLSVVDPAIITPPASQSMAIGHTAFFSVTAAGTAPLSYQWRKNGTNLAEAMSASLTLTNVQLGDTGRYDVVVSNTFGTVASAVAFLTITLDSFDPGANNTVSSLALQTDGKILVGGSFTSLGGQPCNYVGRLNLDGTLDQSFNAGANNAVSSLAIQPDGKIVLAGAFNALDGQWRTRLGRINGDGTVDWNFNPGADGAVRCLAVQADGKIVVGGDFANLGGASCRYLGRLNPDGTLDAGFNRGVDYVVSCLAIQSDGKILVGGAFTQLASRACERFGRLNPDGSLDAAFGADFWVYCLAVQPDDSVVVGGDFSTLGSQPRSRLARLTAGGTLDPTFNPGADAYVYCLAAQTDGGILIGGRFTHVGGLPCDYFGRLNPDGSLDPGIRSGADNVVAALAMQADGKIVVGGNFTTLGGVARNHLGRLNNTDSPAEETSFDASSVTWLRSGTSPEVWRTTFEVSTNAVDWASLGAGSRIAGGWRLGGLSLPVAPLIRGRGFLAGSMGNNSSWFTETFIGPPFVIAQPVSSSNLAGTLVSLAVSVLGSGPLSYQWRKGEMPVTDQGYISGAQTSNLTFSAVLPADAGDYQVTVTNAFGSVTSLVATLNVQNAFITNQPISLTTNAGRNVTFRVGALSMAPLSYQWFKDGLNLSDGGRISGAQNSTLTISNALGGDAGSYLVILSNVYGTVTSQVAILSVVDPVITSQPAAQTVNAGVPVTFSVMAAGTAPLGYQWRKGGTNIDGATGASLIFTNVQQGDAGSYDVVVSSTYGSVTSTVASLTVLLPGLDPLNPGVSGFTQGNWYGQAVVNCLIPQSDGKILVGGSFTNLAGATRSCLGRLNADGTVDGVFQAAADDFIYCMAVEADNRMLVGGLFTRLNGAPRARLGRLYSDGTLDADFNPSANNTVWALALQPDGKILVGGLFTSLCGQPRGHIGRLNPDGTLDPAFAGSTDGSVLSIAVQPDGRILVAGVFGNVGGQPHACVGRLNADGTVDNSFRNVNANWSVMAIGLQPDGKIVVGGEFTMLAGANLGAIGRLNPDGTLDMSFRPRTATKVRSIAVQANGSMVLGAAYTPLVGPWPRDIVRLGPAGSLDPDFQVESDGTVHCVALQTDGGILVAGAFATLANRPRGGIGRLMNTEPATQSLTAADTTITWLRGGSSPEVLWTTFDVSIPEMPSLRLGPGTRVPGGWQVSTPSLPVNATIRALGLVANGFENVSSWFVEDVIGALGIFGQPASQTNNAGTVASFYVDAGSVLPLTYYWFKDGVLLEDGGNILGAQTPTLRLTGVLSRNSGGYSVVISNASGSITSLLATLSVVDPCITGQPVGQSAMAGQTVVFGVTAVGTEPLGYQWYKDGLALADRENISGAQVSTLTLSNVAVADTGGYSVVVSNVSGVVTSQLATLTVLDPFITSQPFNRTNRAGTAAIFGVGGGGTAPLSYQWFKDGTPLPDGDNLSGSQTPTLVLSNVLGADAGGYSVVISNGFGSVTSLVATLTVVDPFITIQPQSQFALPGQTAVLSVVVAGTSPLVYQWRRNGTNLVGEQSAVLTLTDLPWTGSASYDVVVSNSFGSVTSAVAVVTVNLDLLNPGADNSVNSLGLQPDGKILVGGQFTSLDEQACGYMARLHSDGTLDTSFHATADGGVYALAVQTDGKVLIGGAFDNLNGQARGRLGRLRADGTLDPSINLPADGVDAVVYAMALQVDGKILVGGSFTSLGGQTRGYIGRLDADGALDALFDPSANDTVSALAVQPDGEILVGGSFGTLGGVAHGGIGRLNAVGTAETAFNATSGGSVLCLAVQPDGKILVGGDFTTLCGEAHRGIGRLNGDGTLDRSFNPGANGYVLCLALQTDGRILMGGGFNSLGGQARNRIGRVNADGTLDTVFDPGANSDVQCLALQADGKILAGGTFTTLGGLSRVRIGRINNTEPTAQNLTFAGSTITWLRGGTSPEVWRTTFEASTNPLDWSGLGEGTRVPGGWQLTGVSVPTNATIRARGFVIGGIWNNSSWFVESTLSLAPPTPPVILSKDPSFGFGSNGFGFEFTGDIGQTVIVEASTNLVSWIPLVTNLLGPGPIYFSDPDAGTLPWRFYRARVP